MAEPSWEDVHLADLDALLELSFGIDGSALRTFVLRYYGASFLEHLPEPGTTPKELRTQTVMQLVREQPNLGCLLSRLAAQARLRNVDPAGPVSRILKQTGLSELPEAPTYDPVGPVPFPWLAITALAFCATWWLAVRVAGSGSPWVWLAGGLTALGGVLALAKWLSPATIDGVAERLDRWGTRLSAFGPNELVKETTALLDRFYGRSFLSVRAVFRTAMFSVLPLASFYGTIVTTVMLAVTCAGCAGFEFPVVWARGDDAQRVLEELADAGRVPEPLPESGPLSASPPGSFNCTTALKAEFGSGFVPRARALQLLPSPASFSSFHCYPEPTPRILMHGSSFEPEPGLARDVGTQLYDRSLHPVQLLGAMELFPEDLVDELPENYFTYVTTALFSGGILLVFVTMIVVNVLCDMVSVLYTRFALHYIVARATTVRLVVVVLIDVLLITGLATAPPFVGAALMFAMASPDGLISLTSPEFWLLPPTWLTPPDVYPEGLAEEVPEFSLSEGMQNPLATPIWFLSLAIGWAGLYALVASPPLPGDPTLYQPPRWAHPAPYSALSGSLPTMVLLFVAILVAIARVTGNHLFKVPGAVLLRVSQTGSQGVIAGFLIVAVGLAYLWAHLHV